MSGDTMGKTKEDSKFQEELLSDFGPNGVRVYSMILNTKRDMELIREKVGLSEPEMHRILTFLIEKGKIKDRDLYYYERTEGKKKNGQQPKTESKQLNAVEKMINDKFGKAGLMAVNLVDGSKTIEQISKEAGIPEQKLFEIFVGLEEHNVPGIYMPGLLKKNDEIRKPINKKYGDIGIYVLNLIGPMKTKEEIAKKTGLSKEKLSEILGYIEKTLRIDVAKLEKAKQKFTYGWKRYIETRDKEIEIARKNNAWPGKSVVSAQKRIYAAEAEIKRIQSELKLRTSILTWVRNVFC